MIGRERKQEIPMTLKVKTWLSEKYDLTLYNATVVNIFKGSGGKTMCSIRIEPKPGTETDSLGAHGTNLFEIEF